MGSFIDMKGKKYGRLSVTGNAGKNKGGTYRWKCICECGNEKIVLGTQLRSGGTKSCGCLHSPHEEEYILKLKKRLEKYTKKNEKSGCIEWTVENRTTKFGYGFINFRKKQMMAHRASWIVHRGKIPNKMFVCHKCDNAKCINPDHLFLATHKENMQDMRNKKRCNNENKGSKGIKNGSAKLDDELVIFMRILKSEKTYSELSIMFEVSPALARSICKRKIWPHVTEEDEHSYDFSKYPKGGNPKYCPIILDMDTPK